jgi:tripartite-type tricarboxylate transporter receptor subunit TctC
MPIDRRLALPLLGASLLLAGIPRAQAQAYPGRPVRIIVPYPPGGPYDGIPRLVAQWIGARYGWPTVIDNRTGGAGIIGVMAARQAAPDGYTLVVATSGPHGAIPALKRGLAYDPVKDFASIVLLADAALVLLVRAELPVRDVAQLVAMMREKPGALTYSTGGHGSAHHLATMTLLHRAGLPPGAAVHVPFAGLAPALTALIAGNVQFMFVSTGTAHQHIAGGMLRALATTSEARSPRLPDVPTLVELGFADFQVVPWCGLAAPAGTPAEIVARWNALANEALRDPSLRAQIVALDYEPRGGTAEAFAQLIAQDIERYRRLAADMGLAED